MPKCGTLTRLKKGKDSIMKKIVPWVRASMVSCGIALMAVSCTQSHDEMQKTQTVTTEAREAVDHADPQMRAVLDELTALNPKPIATLNADEARMQPSATDAVMKLMKDKGMSTTPQEVGGVKSVNISGPGGDLGIRVYTPHGDGPFPALVYLHGGGWVIGTIDAYVSSCRVLANTAKCAVLAVNYRQAPEHKFPAPLEDCYAATQYIMAHPEQFNIDRNKIAIAGESAGGNMASAVCMMSRDRGGMMPIYQLLIYPVTDYNLNTPSYIANVDAKPLNRAMMKWFFDQYLNTPNDGANPYISILRGDMSKLPPETVITDQIDPLHDDGQKYADKLKAAGIQVRYENYDGVTHEFFGMGAVVDTAKRAEMFAADGLQAAFSK
jgi:acetyl esterase